MEVYKKGTAPDDAVYIGRGSAWGNPYVIGKDGDREMVVMKFIRYAFEKQSMEPTWLVPLKGKNLVCFCAPLACHGDVLLKMIGE